MIIFRLDEALARYKITGGKLANEVGVSRSAVSEWRQGNTKPNLDRLDEVMSAILILGDKEQLERFPLQLSDLIYWTPEKEEKS